MGLWAEGKDRIDQHMLEVELPFKGQGAQCFLLLFFKY